MKTVVRLQVFLSIEKGIDKCTLRVLKKVQISSQNQVQLNEQNKYNNYNV